jgi:enoyl-CoA hydratase
MHKVQGRLASLPTSFDAAEVMDRVNAIATSIASAASLAVRASKKMVIANRDISLLASNELERRTFSSLFNTADQKKGMSAFLEKRPP